jgi:hypothetical protein
MIGLAIVLILAGIVLLFFFTYAGVIVGIVGFVLLIALAFGFGRGAAKSQPHQF